MGTGQMGKYILRTVLFSAAAAFDFSGAIIGLTNPHSDGSVLFMAFLAITGAIMSSGIAFYYAWQWAEASDELEVERSKPANVTS